MSRLANALATLWAWAWSAKADKPAAAVEPSASAPKAIAEDQDHTTDQTRAPKDATVEREAPADSPTGLVILDGPRVDGSTALSINPGARGWRIHDALRRQLEQGKKSIELDDADGVPVALALERGAIAGEVVMHTGLVRIAIRAKRAEIQITALASEVEGYRAWYDRELPRAIWWLRGLDLRRQKRPGDLPGPHGCPDLPARLHKLGVVQRRIEICCDVEGLPVTNELQHEIVARASVVTHSNPSTGDVHSVEVGQRAKTKLSVAIYKKPEELARRRGADHAALLARWARECEACEGKGRTRSDAEGCEPSQECEECEGAGERMPVDVTRVEVRLWGDALRLEGLEATHPGAALDEDLLARLWADALGKIRWVEASGAGRKRDRATRPEWTQLREAGGCAEDIRASRRRPIAQIESLRAHHRTRFASHAASVEVLLEGDGYGGAARAELDRVIGTEAWNEHQRQAEARHGDLMAMLERGETT